MSGAGLDLDLADAQAAVAEAVAHFARERCGDERVKAAVGQLPRDLWSELAELGVLSAGTPESEAGAVEAVAAAIELGRGAFPGPLVETAVAAQVLDAEERERVLCGDRIASVGAGGHWPWGPCADVFLEMDAESGELWRAGPGGDLVAIETLGGEPWSRGAVPRGPSLPGAERALAVGELWLAALVAGAGARLVDATAEHARTRVQFGRAIGEFQAVAHPLADAHMAVEGAATLARVAADRLDRGDPDAFGLASAARLSARRAGLEAAHIAHQLFGAQGATLEGPVFHVSRRIRQLASHPLPLDRARAAVLDLFPATEAPA